MASMIPCPKNTAGYIFYVSLVSQANTLIFQANPTLAAGDVQIAIDDGAPANLATLPVVDADFTKRVKIVLSQAETNGDNLIIIFSDAAGAEWCDLTIAIQTATQTFDTTDTAVDAVNAKTTNLPSDPADESLLEAAITAATSPLATTADLATVDGILDDIHGTDLPAVKTDTAAIKAKTDNLPATPADDTSIDTQLATIAGYLDTEVAAILAAVDTEIAAIKAKTDQLAFTVANQVDANALSGGGGLDAAGVRSAVGLASANLDTQLTTMDGILDDIHGTDLPAVKTDTAAIKAKTDNLPTAPADDTSIDTQLGTIAGYLDTEVAAILAAVDTEVAAIKAKTDNLPAAPADDTSIDTQLGTIAGYLDTEVAAILAAVDTEVAAIKAKTDNLPTAPADDTSIDTQLGIIAGYLDTEVAAILAAVDTEVAAIKAKTDNLPAAPADDTSIDTQLATIAGYLDTEVAAILAAVDTEVAAIKAKTDNLPSDPADESLLEAAIADVPTNAELATALAGADDATLAAIAALEWGGGNGGSLAITNYPVTDSVTGLPVVGAIVELYPTNAYTGIIDQQVTFSLGYVTFRHLTAGTYYIKVIRAGYSDFYDSEVAA